MAEITPVTLLLRQPGVGGSVLGSHKPDVAVVTAQPTPSVWWQGGCACCAPRDDVARALRALLPRVRRDEVRHVVIETTSLADPGPILATLLGDTVAASAYRLDGIVTMVDAVGGGAALETVERAVRQVAMADRIVLVTTDLADPSEPHTRDLCTRLGRLNPVAPIVVTRHGAVGPAAVLDVGPSGQGGMVPAGVADGRGWPDHEPGPEPAASEGLTEGDARFQAFCFTFDRPLPWPAMKAWHERLILTHGDALVRVKGVLHLQAEDQPRSVLSIGHLLFPPTTLTAWPDGARRRSWLVVTTRDLSRSVVAAGLPVPVRASAEIASADVQQ